MARSPKCNPRWPETLGEYETLRKILAEGLCYASFGDGEIGCIDSGGSMSQVHTPELAAELTDILRNPHPKCLVGIPTMDDASPRFERWLLFEDRFLAVIDPSSTQTYGSAFLGCRVKSPWIDTREYMEMLRDLHRGKRTCVVAPEDIDVEPLIPGAHVVRCPKRDAHGDIDRIEADVIATSPEVVLLTAGAAAPCLANRLAKRGIQGVDLGRGLGYMRLHKEA